MLTKRTLICPQRSPLITCGLSADRICGLDGGSGVATATGFGGSTSGTLQTAVLSGSESDLVRLACGSGWMGGALTTAGSEDKVRSSRWRAVCGLMGTRGFSFKTGGFRLRMIRFDAGLLQSGASSA